MIICVIPIENVLAQGYDLKSAQPQRWARALYDSLHTQFRMIAFTLADSELANWWLQREMLRDWAGVLTKPDGFNDYGEWKVHQITEFQSETWEVGLMVDVDSGVLELVNQLGVMTLKLSPPSARVGWRAPDAPLRTWSNVVDTL